MHFVLFTTAVIFAAVSVEGFAPTPFNRKLHSRKLGVADLKASTEIFEAVRGPIESYVNIWTPTFKEYAPLLPEAIVHWGHGAAMATVLVAMGGIGTFLGWQIRLGNGENTYSFTLDKSAREMHPIIMGLATFFFLLGGQGGLVLLATQGKDILHSDHALTAFVGLGLLAVQVRDIETALSYPTAAVVHVKFNRVVYYLKT